MLPRLLAVLLALALLGAPARAEPFTLLLDWFVNPDHAPLIVAKAGGHFARAGLDVEIVEPADPSQPPRLVAAGRGDVAVTYQPIYFMQVKEDLPVQRIGTLVATPLNALITLADGPVRTLADLKGKTVGYSAAGFESVALGTMLASVGLAKEDVTLVNVNFALTPALLSGRVDAIIGAYRNFELTEIELAGRKARAFYVEEHGVPPYDELIYVARLDRAGAPAMRAFLDAVEAATVALLNDPEGSWALAVKAYPRLDDALNRRAWTDTLRRFQASPAAVDPRRYARFGAFMKARGMIETVAPIERYIGAR